jgi:acyl dehydratase
MSIDRDKLLAIEIPTCEQDFTERDTMLYALSIGYGHDPLDKAALRYCYEHDLRAAPTLPFVLCHPGFWMRDLDTGIDWRRIVHGEQELELHGPIPVAGHLMSRTRVVDVIDKGKDKGAVVVFDRELLDAGSGTRIATMRQTNLCRGDGGFGGTNRQMIASSPAPVRAPDIVVSLATIPEAALLYRLSADPNPLHADPEMARIAGFERPILHGLATLGVVAHAILRAICDYDPRRFKRLRGRFASPVFPGDTIRTEIWRDGTSLVFQAYAQERNALVISNGSIEISPS